jgi:hypothetical protein
MTTLAQYRTLLMIHKHRLDDELEIQSQVLDQISTQVVIHNSRSLQAKEDLAKMEGSLLEDFKESETKLSVAMIDAKIRRDPDRVKAWNAYQSARAEHEAWVGMLEAWRQRGYSIKTLADLYAAQYFTIDSTHMTQRQRDRNATGDEVRADARKASHRVSQIDVTKEGINDEQAPTRSSRRSVI